jgi:hypothetical protein
MKNGQKIAQPLSIHVTCSQLELKSTTLRLFVGYCRSPPGEDLLSRTLIRYNGASLRGLLSNVHNETSFNSLDDDITRQLHNIPL